MYKKNIYLQIWCGFNMDKQPSSEKDGKKDMP